MSDQRLSENQQDFVAFCRKLQQAGYLDAKQIAGLRNFTADQMLGLQNILAQSFYRRASITETFSNSVIELFDAARREQRREG